MTNGERSVDRKDAQLALADRHGLRACPVALVVGLTQELNTADAVSSLTANSTPDRGSGDTLCQGSFLATPSRLQWMVQMQRNLATPCPSR